MSAIPSKVAVIGAGGRVGGAITTALLSTGKHTVTAVTRPNSSSTFADGVVVKKAEGHAALVEAFKGQDALVITLGVTAAHDYQTQLIDAAVEAGVKYILPNEWGSDLSDPRQNDIIIHSAKGGYRDYIEKKGAAWIAQVNGQWYDFSMAGGGYDIDMVKRHATLYDGGDVKTVTTTVAQSGRAAAAILSQPASWLHAHANSFVYVESFYLTQNEMLAAAQRATGTSASDWTVEHKAAAPLLKEVTERLNAGDFSVLREAIYLRNWTPNPSQGDYRAKGIANKELRLPVEDLDEQTKVAYEKAKSGKF